MSRAMIKTAYHCSYEEAQRKISSILSMRGFKITTKKNGERVWKKGIGLLTAMQFVKIEFSQNVFIMHAWVQTLGFGRFGESDLTGVFGLIPKKQLARVLEEIRQAF